MDDISSDLIKSGVEGTVKVPSALCQNIWEQKKWLTEWTKSPNPISGNDGILYYTRRLNCISILHNGFFCLKPLCPCDNCCIAFYWPTALLRDFK